ncbi:MAG: hypothetical protein U0326_20045 [Polyangiales bacterium]
MSGALRRCAIPLALALTLTLSGTGPVGAQQAGNAAAVTGTPLELEALRLYNENKPLAARTKAEEALRSDPESLIANYVLGCVLREAEGSLPRAMYHLGHARELYETRYGLTRPAGAPWQVHRETLFAIQSLAGEMEEYDYQLHVLEFHDYLYDPDLLAEHAWPLLHLKRYDEARDFARRAVATGDAWQQSLGRNALCAIEGAARQRQAQYTACLDAFRNAEQRARGSTDTNPATAPHVTVHAYNAALGAWAVLRHDEVERLATEGTRRLEFTTANPWRILARLYVDEGKMAQAVDALREMQGWRVRQPANLRDQDRAETDAAVAETLLVAAEAETGIRFISRALERPDRRGLVASDAEQALGAHALLRRALERTDAELEAERASYSNFTARVSGAYASLGSRLASSVDDERVTSVLADEFRLDSTLRLYVRGGVEPLPVWLVGDLVHVLGAGVVAVALRDVRREEQANPMMSPYYDAIEAEVLLAQGEPERALAMAQRAIQALPQSEALLHARVAAVGAEAARAAGNDQLALGMYERSLQKDPGTLRRMGLSIPASVTVQAGGEAGAKLGDYLERSPRVRDGANGFHITITGDDRGLRTCMTSPLGAQMGCSDTVATRGESTEHLAQRAAEAFHRTAFATRVGLSTQDLRSLDGTTTTNDAAAREQMNGVLRDISREGPTP